MAVSQSGGGRVMFPLCSRCVPGYVPGCNLFGILAVPSVPSICLVLTEVKNASRKRTHRGKCREQVGTGNISLHGTGRSTAVTVLLVYMMETTTRSASRADTAVAAPATRTGAMEVFGVGESPTPSTKSRGWEQRFAPQTSPTLWARQLCGGRIHEFDRAG
jgi:hypothetical protein